MLVGSYWKPVREDQSTVTRALYRYKEEFR